MDVIYKPSGPAADYAHLACNLFRGCKHRCWYCYGPKATRNKRFFTEQKVRREVLKKLKADAQQCSGTADRVLLCFTCDPYQPIEAAEQVTRQALQILKAYNVPWQILTKAGMAAFRDFDLYGPRDLFGVTLTYCDSDESLKYEPYAATPFERIAALQAAKVQGIETFVSLEPVTDPAIACKFIKELHTWVDVFRIGKMNHQKNWLTWQQWRDFGVRAIQLCNELGVQYYIKAELARYLDGIKYVNTDRRKVVTDE